MTLPNDPRLKSQRKLVSQKRAFRLSCITRLTQKLHDLLDENGVDYVERILDQASGNTFSANPEINDTAPHIIIAIITDVLDVRPEELYFGKNARGWWFKESEKRLLALFANMYTKYVDGFYREQMGALFNLNGNTCTKYKQQYLVPKTISIPIAERHQHVLTEAAKQRQLPHHLYVAGKTLFLEEMVDLLVWSMIGYPSFTQQEQSSLSAYYESIITQSEKIKKQFTKK